MTDKIILATVNSKKMLYSDTADVFAAIAPNIQLGLLDAYLTERNIPHDVIDSEIENLSFDDLIDITEKEAPTLLGIVCTGANPSSSTMTMAGVADFFNRWNERESNIKTFIWGAHPTVLPERTLDETGTNFVVRGEGYESIIQLFKCVLTSDNLDRVESISYKIHSNGKVKYFHNELSELCIVESLPIINWDKFLPSKYRAHNWHCFGDIDHRAPYAIIWTSFGCPFPCSFCNINNIFGRRTQRFRNIDSVISEIDILVAKHNVKHLKILDELFVTHPRRVIEFCDKIIERKFGLNMWAYSRVDTISEKLLEKLKLAGVNWISYGFESPSKKRLKEVKKGTDNIDTEKVIQMTQRAGISICADIIYGLENEDMASLERTYDFLTDHNFEWANGYPLFKYPGTELYDFDQNSPASWKAYALYGYECEPAGTKYLSPAQTLKFRDEAFIRYHSRPAYLSMIREKFGRATENHIRRMVQQPLRRRIVEESGL